MRVFLSYRREDSSGHAGRLADALVQRFGPKGVFQDVAAIEPGRDFIDAIERGLRDCEAVLVVIGPEWLSAVGPSGTPRLKEPDDYVRLELKTALSLDVPVVPVLVGGAELPTAVDLPADIRALGQRQAVVLHDETWRLDVDGLVRSLRGESRTRERGMRPMFMAGLVVVVLVGIAGWLWLGASSNNGAGNGGSELAVCNDPSGPTYVALELLEKASGDIPLESGNLHVTVENGGYREIAPGRWEVVLTTKMENQTQSAEYHAYWHYGELAVDGRRFEKSCFAPEIQLDPTGKSVARVGFEVGHDPSGILALVLDEGAVIDLTS